MPTIQSNFLFLKAVIKDVSQGSGPSALIPKLLANSMDGIISSFSYVPNSAWGLRA